METKILVPVDFSEGTNHAAEMAADMADFTGAGIILLHAINHYTRAYLKSNDLDESWIEEKLEELSKKILIGRELMLEKAIKEGTLYETIPSVAKEFGASLTAFSSHGKEGLQRITKSKVLRLIAANPVPSIIFSKKLPRRLSPAIIPINLFRKWGKKLNVLVSMSHLWGKEFVIVETYAPEALSSELERQRAKFRQEAERQGLNITFVPIRGEHSFLSEFSAHARATKASLIILISDEEEQSPIFKPGIGEKILIYNKLKLPVLCLSPSMELIKTQS
ncbi:MAG: universal stress protein [Bacteroidales bacterium]|jgi:nucleotide-binding universal stress UspA family protein|nr:universal stress protein [Bacteroidales bacterium]NPV37038.1 universal stress protein [Bacteroidales bacterium]